MISELKDWLAEMWSRDACGKTGMFVLDAFKGCLPEIKATINAINMDLMIIPGG
jgi:hypothetical protein